ncbi:hypothetical protein ILYODFUR_036098 [Ilyodon furcidens]|uniref:Uncharacterized protein n=1 Tax=Ilyodon furcidens TaxID=33524 RepID=A0ABV0U2E1_9TELE
MGTPVGPPPGLGQPLQKTAEENPRETTQQPQCRSPRKLKRRANRPCRQWSVPEQIQPWTQDPSHIVPQAEARQSQGAQAECTFFGNTYSILPGMCINTPEGQPTQEVGNIQERGLPGPNEPGNQSCSRMKNF